MSIFNIDEDELTLSLINDITAVCSVDEGSCNEMGSKRWTSEELLSTCALLLKEDDIPCGVSNEIPFVIPSSEKEKDKKVCTTTNERLFDDLDPFCFLSNNSLLPDSSSSSSSLISSSFNSCESVFEEFALSEETIGLHAREDSPFIYHSCSSLTDLDDPINEAKSEVFFPPTEEPLITSSSNRKVRSKAFDGADVIGSDRGESCLYDSVTGFEKEFFCPGDSEELIENTSTKYYKDGEKNYNSRCKNITHETHNKKMQHLPSSLKTSLGDGGVACGEVNERNIFPSSLPGLEAGSFSAKELDDVTCDLFCLPFEENKITFSSCHYLSNLTNEEGKKKDEDKEGTIKEVWPSLSEICPKVCDNWPTNIVTTLSTSRPRKKVITTDSSILAPKILTTAAANIKKASAVPEKTTTAIYEGTSADVGESYCGFCDYFCYLYFKNYKYFNRDEIICANKKIPTFLNMFIEEKKTKDDELGPHHAVVISEDDKSMFLNSHLPKMLFSNPSTDCNKKCCDDDKSDAFSGLRGEIRSSPPENFVLTPDYVPCKRLSNLFHAVPVLIEYPDGDSDFQQECDAGTLLMGSSSANECYLSDHSSLLNCDINDAVNRQFSTINSYNGHDRKTNLASNMKSSQCQFFVGTGTVSDSAVSDDFGAVAKDLNVIKIQKCGENNEPLFIGEITFSVYGKILSYPIFIDLVENENVSKDFSFVSENTHFSLATGGRNWNLCLDKNELLPVVQILEDIMANNLSDDNNGNSSMQQFSTCRLYGFTISSNENSRVKNLIPLFNQKAGSKGTVPCRRSSISTSVPLRRSVSFADKSHRNSAACDVEMYRNSHQFFPLKEKTGFDSISGDSNFKVHSVVINNPVIDNTPPTISEQHNILKNDSELLPDIGSKEVNSSDNLKPPCVLRSKSDSKIISGLNIKRETCRSISLNTPEAECPSNLSRFRGVTLVEDQELSTSEIEAKAFLSSYLERSMTSEEKAGRDESNILIYEDENSLSPNTTSSNNLKTAMAVNRILSHINNAEEILNYPNTGININPTVPGNDQHPSELLLTPDVQYENILSLQSSFPERTPSPVGCSENISNNPTLLTPSTTSLTYTTSGVIFSGSSPLPCTSASLMSSCSVTNVTPLMTKMSVLPMMESSFSEAPFKHSVSSYIDNSDNQHSKNKIKENVEKRNFLPTRVSRSSSLKSRVENIVMQQEKNSPPPLAKVSRSSSLKSKNGNIVTQQGTPSPPPRRLSYSTKFPMDIICQGRLEEMKRKTAPPGEYSPFTDTRSSIWGSRKYSVGQVKPLKENYPTSRSKSAGRMDFGRTSFRKTSPEIVQAFKDDSKNLVKESHTAPQSICVSSSVPVSYSNEYETVNINSIPKHKLSEVIKEEPEGDGIQEINTSCILHPRPGTNLASNLENRPQSLRSNNLLLSYIDNLVISLVNVRTFFPFIQEHYQNTKNDSFPEVQQESRKVEGKNCSQTLVQSAVRVDPTFAHLDLLSNNSLSKSKPSSFDDEKKGMVVESVSETHETSKSPDNSLHKIISPESILESESLNKLSEIHHCTVHESSKNFRTSDSPVRYFEANESFSESGFPERIIESIDQDFRNVISTNILHRKSESPEYFYSTSETPFKHNQEEESSEGFRKSSESPDKFYSIIETLPEPLKYQTVLEAQENSNTGTFLPKSFPVKEFLEGHEENQPETILNVTSTFTMSENIPRKPSDYYINNIQIPQLKSGSSLDTEIDKVPDNVSTDKGTLGGIVKDVFSDRMFTCENITKSPDLCITSSSANSSYISCKTQNLDISLTNSPDLKISSRKSPDCNIKNLADIRIGRESDVITQKDRPLDSHTFTHKTGLCQDFRESPDLVIKSQPLSDTRTSRSPELDITVRNSPILSIRTSKSPDVPVRSRKYPDVSSRTRKSPDESTRTRKSPDLIVSAQKVTEINQNFVKPIDSFKQTRKSPDLLINALNSSNIFPEYPNSYIQEETSSFPISRVSPEQIEQDFFVKDPPSLSGFEKRKSPDSESNNYHWETTENTIPASTEAEILSLHYLNTSKDIKLPENFKEERVPIWETMNLNEKPADEFEVKKHEASLLSSLGTQCFVPGTTLVKFTPEKDLNVAPVSGVPLPDVADVGRFSIKSQEMNLASPELGSPDDVETVRSFFEVSHHKTVDLEEQSDNANTGIILKSELKIDPDVFLSSDVHNIASIKSFSSPFDIRNEEGGNVPANTPAPLLFSSIPSTDFLTSSKCSEANSSIKDSTWPYTGESETGTPTKSLSYYVDNIFSFIDSDGNENGNILHRSEDIPKDTCNAEEPVVTQTKFATSTKEGMESTMVSAGKSSTFDTKEVQDYVSPGTLIPKSSDIGISTLSSTTSSYHASHSSETAVVPDVIKPEVEPHSTTFEYSEGAVELFTSVSPSLVGPVILYNSNQGPVARRDLFPLNDDDVTPHWHALLEVNAPDSEDDEPMCYDTDEDDFESMDAEMRRLEEKLKKFERELGGGVSSEGEGEEQKGAFESSSKLDVKTTSRDRNTSSVLLRLRQEDIDVLRSFSLPEVYPPVDMRKTKHLSLLKNEEDVLGENIDVDEDVGPTRKRQRTFSGSINSNNVNIEKFRHRRKHGVRKCRSLDARKLCCKWDSGPSVRKLDQIPVVVTKEVPPIIIEDIEKKSEALCYIDDDDDLIEETSFIDEREIDEEDETYGSYSLYSESRIDTELTSSGYLVGEDLCDGVIWREDVESEFSLFDCYGLESILNYKRPVGKDYLFFIFEDDDDNDDEVEFYSSGQDTNYSHYADGTFLLPVSTDNTYSARESPISCEDSQQEDIEQSCRKKRDISLVSAFKNSFRKAAKYLGPVSPSTSPKSKNSPSCEVERSSSKEKESDSYSMSGSYNVRTGQVQGASLNEDDDDDETYGSGEFYASPALCILTSDEEHIENPSTIHIDDNWKSVQDRLRSLTPSSLHQSPNRTPPPVPPRKSVLMQNVADQIEITGRTDKHHHPHHYHHSPHQGLTSDPTIKQSSSPPTPTTFLRNLTKKAVNLVDEKSKEIGHGMTVTSGGRTDHLGRGVGVEGNDKSLSSPRPKVLPEHRTWLTRGVSGACAKCVCLFCTSANSFFPFYLLGSASSCPQLLTSINQPPEHCSGAKTNSGLSLGREMYFHASSVLLNSPPVSHESCTGTSLTSKSSPPPWSPSSPSSTSSSKSELLWVPKSSTNYFLYPFASIFTNQSPSLNLFPPLTPYDVNGVSACVKEAIPSFWNPISPSCATPSQWNISPPSACAIQRGNRSALINKLFHYSASESDLDS